MVTTNTKEKVRFKAELEDDDLIISKNEDLASQRDSRLHIIDLEGIDSPENNESYAFDLMQKLNKEINVKNHHQIPYVSHGNHSKYDHVKFTKESYTTEANINKSKKYYNELKRQFLYSEKPPMLNECDISNFETEHKVTQKIMPISNTSEMNPLVCLEDTVNQINEPSSIIKQEGTSQMMFIDNFGSDLNSMKSFESCSTKKDIKLSDVKMQRENTNKKIKNRIQERIITDLNYTQK